MPSLWLLVCLALGLAGVYALWHVPQLRERLHLQIGVAVLAGLLLTAAGLNAAGLRAGDRLPYWSTALLSVPLLAAAVAAIAAQRPESAAVATLGVVGATSLLLSAAGQGLLAAINLLAALLLAPAWQMLVRRQAGSSWMRKPVEPALACIATGLFTGALLTALPAVAADAPAVGIAAVRESPAVALFSRYPITLGAVIVVSLLLLILARQTGAVDESDAGDGSEAEPDREAA